MALLLVPRPTFASFHLWTIDEVFSDSTGSLQFIELNCSFGSQQFLNGQSFKTNSHTLPFASNLPSDTLNKHFVLATQAFATKYNTAPDYTIPSNFFSTQGDILNYANANSFSFTSGQLPTDGLHSLLGDHVSKPVAAATNFSGKTVAVPEPGLMSLLALAIPALLRRRRN
jgi:MYXO-CTERM domain-containing protein